MWPGIELLRWCGKRASVAVVKWDFFYLSLFLSPNLYWNRLPALHDRQRLF